MNQYQPTAVASATVYPQKHLAVLSAAEVNDLCAAQDETVYSLFRRCALAVLTSGIVSDDARQLSEIYRDFSVTFEQVDRGIVLHLHNAPASAFVDGEMIAGLREHLFSVLRDIIFVKNEINPVSAEAQTSEQITEIVFRILRQADLVRAPRGQPIVVCWGGHSIGPVEYDYAKEVGYELGLRGLNIGTGCGPGAMKGPMKGAAIAHAKQRIRQGRYIGISEPGIIAAEAPNAIVNELVILPDIEKRLEAFIRLGHGIVVFPGGAGTLEEILYLLGVLSHPRNDGLPFPLVLTGPQASRDYFKGLDDFISLTLGPDFQRRYEILINDPVGVARHMREGVDLAARYRDSIDDASYFNWSLTIAPAFQHPFEPTHEAMAKLTLSRDLPPHELASQLRCAFSGIVAGNVKENGIKAVENGGPFQLHADKDIAQALDSLLRSFVADQRMRLPGQEYTPCYEVIC